MNKKSLLVLAVILMGLMAPMPVMARSGRTGSTSSTSSTNSTRYSDTSGSSTYDDEDSDTGSRYSGYGSYTSTQNFYFKDFTADYYLTKNPDGTSKLHVKEMLTAEFPNSNQNHGITRAIPRFNQDNQNTVVPSQEALNLKVLRNGKPETVSKIDWTGDTYTAYIGNAIDYAKGEQVYTLEYDFGNVVTEFDENGQNVSGVTGVSKAWQELYWDTNGTGWQQKFNKVTANLHLPVKIEGEPSCYVGRQGAKGSGRCKITKLDDGVSFTASNLAAGENLTFAVKMAPESFVVERYEDYTVVVALVAEIVVSGLGILWLWLRWNKRGRPQRKLYKETFMKPEYQPPAGINVAEGGIMRIWSSKNTYVATLLELAVAKAMTIKDGSADGEGGVLKKMGIGRWEVTINANPAQFSGSQLNMLRILADKDTLAQGEVITVRRHSESYRLRGYAQDYVRDAEQTLVGAGYLESIKRHGLREIGFIFLWMLWLFAEGFVVMIGASAEAEGMVAVGQPVLPIVCQVLALATIAIMIWLTIMTSNYSKYTEKGVALVRVIEGLKMYVKMVETDRLKFLQSVQGVDTSPEGIVKLYEKMLPWACLFGCETSWANELNRYYEMTETRPAVDTWMLNGVMLSQLTRSVNTSVASGISVSSSSSSSSGGGGGGFSGGGGGGGGGGGW